MKMKMTTKGMRRGLLVVALLVMWIADVDAQYVGFNIPGIEGTEAGYDFDGPGPFTGVWHPAGTTTNGLLLTLNPQFNLLYYLPEVIVPWNSAQLSLAYEGFDWDMRWWVTNYTGQVSGLASGEIVTIFFLYQTGAEEMKLSLDNQVIGSVFRSEETNTPSRLECYCWVTNGVPDGFRVLGCSVRMTDSILEFELTQVPLLTNSPTIDLAAIVVDTNNTSAIDNDQDGQPDWQEVITGMDPLDSNSVFRITEFTRATQDGFFVVSWPSTSNRSYRVESRTNLVEESGGQLITNVVAEPPLNSVTTGVHVTGNEFITIQVTD